MEPFFLSGHRGRLFCVYHAASSPLPGEPALLHLPAFADEMNKSRRMVALAARALAARGVASLMLDPFGTGDSEGEFVDARWDTWLGDAETGVDELRRRGHQRIGAWGLRTGCLLAAELAALVDLDPLLWWQPVLSGDQFLNQFLRLRVAGAKLRGEEGESVKDLRASLDAGISIEVAGYEIGGALAGPMGACALAGIAPPAGRTVLWLEVNASGSPPGPAASRVLDAWVAAGAHAHGEGVAGEPFWSTQEISTAPTLVERSASAVCEVLTG